MILQIPPALQAKSCVKENLIEVPKKPGCYLIWRGLQIIYVGVAGKSWTETNPKTSHLKHRLGEHFRATKSDVFPIMVFERFVLNYISELQIENITTGKMEIRHLARDYIREHLSFTFVSTDNFSDADKTEKFVRKGGLGDKPLLNPMD